MANQNQLHTDDVIGHSDALMRNLNFPQHSPEEKSCKRPAVSAATYPCRALTSYKKSRISINDKNCNADDHEGNVTGKYPGTEEPLLEQRLGVLRQLLPPRFISHLSMNATLEDLMQGVVEYVKEMEMQIKVFQEEVETNHCLKQSNIRKDGHEGNDNDKPPHHKVGELQRRGLCIVSLSSHLEPS